MDMSGLANVKRLKTANGSVITYDEFGNPVVTNASLKNGNGTPVAAYSLISGTSPYSQNNDYSDTISRWSKARASGQGEKVRNVSIVRELVKSQGVDVSGMSDDEVMETYLNDIQKNSYNMSSLDRVTGTASTSGLKQTLTNQSAWNRATAKNVRRGV